MYSTGVTAKWCAGHTTFFTVWVHEKQMTLVKFIGGLLIINAHPIFLYISSELSLSEPDHSDEGHEIWG